jgi:hypothetical protein
MNAKRAPLTPEQRRERELMRREEQDEQIRKRAHELADAAPPLSEATLSNIAEIVIGAERNKQQHPELFDVWELTLRCGHKMRMTAHRDNRDRLGRVQDCDRCQARRAVADQRLVGSLSDRAPHKGTGSK